MSRSRRPNRQRRVYALGDVLCDCWLCIRSSTKRHLIVEREDRRRKLARWRDDE